MSFVPGFAPDAESEWRALDFDLQELVLDELESAAANPPPTPPDVILRDIACDVAGQRRYVFLRIVVDRPGRHVTAIGVLLHTRPCGTKS